MIFPLLVCLSFVKVAWVVDVWDDLGKGAIGILILANI